MTNQTLERISLEEARVRRLLQDAMYVQSITRDFHQGAVVADPALRLAAGELLWAATRLSEALNAGG